MRRIMVDDARRRLAAKRGGDAVEVTLQPGEKSYTDADLKAVSDRIVTAAAKLGAELRG